jgi:hypothetical protein
MYSQCFSSDVSEMKLRMSLPGHRKTVYNKQPIYKSNPFPPASAHQRKTLLEMRFVTPLNPLTTFPPTPPRSPSSSPNKTLSASPSTLNTPPHGNLLDLTPVSVSVSQCFSGFVAAVLELMRGGIAYPLRVPGDDTPPTPRTSLRDGAAWMPSVGLLATSDAA